METYRHERITAANSTYKKLAVQWLNEPDSYRDFVVADSFVLSCLPAGKEIAKSCSYKTLCRMLGRNPRIQES